MYLIIEASSAYSLCQLLAPSYAFSFLFSVSSCTSLELLLPTCLWFSAPTCVLYFTLTVGDSSTYLLQAFCTILRFVLIIFTFTYSYFYISDSLLSDISDNILWFGNVMDHSYSLEFYNQYYTSFNRTTSYMHLHFTYFLAMGCVQLQLLRYSYNIVIKIVL